MIDDATMLTAAIALREWMTSHSLQVETLKTSLWMAFSLFILNSPPSVLLTLIPILASLLSFSPSHLLQLIHTVLVRTTSSLSQTLSPHIRSQLLLIIASLFHHLPSLLHSQALHVWTLLSRLSLNRTRILTLINLHTLTQVHAAIPMEEECWCDESLLQQVSTLLEEAINDKNVAVLGKEKVAEILILLNFVECIIPDLQLTETGSRMVPSIVHSLLLLISFIPSPSPNPVPSPSSPLTSLLVEAQHNALVNSPSILPFTSLILSYSHTLSHSLVIMDSHIHFTILSPPIFVFTSIYSPSLSLMDTSATHSPDSLVTPVMELTSQLLSVVCLPHSFSFPCK